MRTASRLLCSIAAVLTFCITFPATQEVQAQTNPGQILISEFRFRGPTRGTSIDSVSDEFVEIYNNSDSPVTVSTTDSSSGWALVGSDGVTRFVIPVGTVIPARGHFLGVNSDDYSLANYGGSNVAAGDAAWTTAAEIPDGAGIAIFNTSNPANFTLANRFDAVGFAGMSNTLYKEGSGLTPAGGIALNGSDFGSDAGTASFENMAFVRRMGTGVPQDTGNNQADFEFITTRGFNQQDAVGNVRVPVLGAPGPENLSSPIQRNAQFPASLVDTLASPSSPPNRVRDTTPGSTLFSTFGTMHIRRMFTNNTGGNVTRLRFRVIDVTTLNSPNVSGGAQQADLRPLDSPSVNITRTDGSTVLVSGISVQTPPNQPRGGGLNTSLILATVSTASPLAPGATVNVNFTLGVQQTGRFRFFVNVEALP